jgi:hypothetical protein
MVRSCVNTLKHRPCGKPSCSLMRVARCIFSRSVALDFDKRFLTYTGLGM